MTTAPPRPPPKAAGAIAGGVPAMATHRPLLPHTRVCRPKRARGPQPRGLSAACSSSRPRQLKRPGTHTCPLWWEVMGRPAAGAAGDGRSAASATATASARQVSTTAPVTAALMCRHTTKARVQTTLKQGETREDWQRAGAGVMPAVKQGRVRHVARGIGVAVTRAAVLATELQSQRHPQAPTRRVTGAYTVRATVRERAA